VQPIKTDDSNFVFRGSPPVVDLSGVATPEFFSSAWIPTPEELALLNAGHAVRVTILNNGQAIFPLAIDVSQTPTSLF
jgi:hypothetical protein